MTSTMVGPFSPGLAPLGQRRARRWPSGGACRARMTDSSAAASSSARRAVSGRSIAPAAREQRRRDTVATSRSPLVLSVEPVETRSTMTSATPRCGATSAAPETERRVLSVEPAVPLGQARNDVATRSPSAIGGSRTGLSRTATEPAAAEAQVEGVATSRPLSSTRSRPVIPGPPRRRRRTRGCLRRARRAPNPRPAGCSARAAKLELQPRAPATRGADSERPLFGKAMRIIVVR